jgi:hypothetical protein
VDVGVGTLLARMATTSKVEVGAVSRGCGPRPHSHRIAVTVAAETSTFNSR